MKVSEIHLKDGLDTMTDTLSDRRPKSLYHTDVECRNELGELLFKKSNVILLGGRRFTLEKLFNISPVNEKRLTLNRMLSEKLGVEYAGDYVYDEAYNQKNGTGPKREQHICLFGVGDMGSGLTFGSLSNPSAKESNLYNILPIRFVSPEDAPLVEATNQYFMKMPHTMEDGEIMYGYYLKAFDNVPEIKLMLGTKEYIPEKDFNIPSYGDSASSYTITDDVDAYIEIKLHLGEEDVREYFEATDKLENSRINELALYFGVHEGNGQVWSDYTEVEAFSKLTFNNESLLGNSKELNIIYRIYI